MNIYYTHAQGDVRRAVHEDFTDHGILLDPVSMKRKRPCNPYHKIDTHSYGLCQQNVGGRYSSIDSVTRTDSADIFHLARLLDPYFAS